MSDITNTAGLPLLCLNRAAWLTLGIAGAVFAASVVSPAAAGGLDRARSQCSGWRAFGSLTTDVDAPGRHPQLQGRPCPARARHAGPSVDRAWSHRHRGRRAVAVAYRDRSCAGLLAPRRRRRDPAWLRIDAIRRSPPRAGCSRPRERKRCRCGASPPSCNSSPLAVQALRRQGRDRDGADRRRAPEPLPSTRCRRSRPRWDRGDLLSRVCYRAPAPLLADDRTTFTTR